MAALLECSELTHRHVLHAIATGAGSTHSGCAHDRAASVPRTSQLQPVALADVVASAGFEFKHASDSVGSIHTGKPATRRGRRAAPIRLAARREAAMAVLATVTTPALSSVRAPSRQPQLATASGTSYIDHTRGADVDESKHSDEPRSPRAAVGGGGLQVGPTARAAAAGAPPPCIEPPPLCDSRGGMGQPGHVSAPVVLVSDALRAAVEQLLRRRGAASSGI